ncbi:ribulose-phosphate 3-epimerase [Vibrio tubiashii]|uniref:Pentose-5-phosphate 3-epimerase n=1 Tax=Vibrio tubiashii ATCC 19109 TaxID=1051646 RepID=F9T0S2_9VIBR|nr:pentose-5-phosphate 3-epimerase [Vibrio tubiashii]AIW16962.1 pentose-5-phosphate 3-epimerase [Vibrio tubiashii ATCC 19109]EGU58598.1 putative pentose-5-phosphate-3-epimerase [Vibrio tubiashii ATCC 19109]EIF04707.1 pentose-5-phosphate-3-epimerase [Vibrio tubiashii NCIMB 1337 = ATCC 19106]
MKKVKIAAGLAHVDYGHMADIVKEVSDAGADYIHCDAADMHDLKNMQLMGGHQIVEGIRQYTDKPIEVHAYFKDCDRLFVEKIAAAGADMLILPAENFLGAPLAYMMKYCRDYNMKFGLTVGCFTPVSFVKEAIYYLDRLHIVIHGVNNDEWLWRESAIEMIREARQLINERNPNCELCVDGGIRNHNLEALLKEDIDVMVASTNIFGHEKGITAGVHDFRTALDQAEKNVAAEVEPA